VQAARVGPVGLPASLAVTTSCRYAAGDRRASYPAVADRKWRVGIREHASPASAISENGLG